MSDLAQRLHVRPSSLQRELASLTEAGILKREPDGNRVYYRAALDFPLLPELQSLLVKSVGLADKIKSALASSLSEADFAFIYGSVARGERRPESDVDVMVIGPVRMSELTMPLRGLERELQTPINISLYTRTEWAEKLDQGHHFLSKVMQEPKIFLKGTEHGLADAFGGQKGQSAHNEQAGT